MAMSTDEPREAARATPMVLRSRAAKTIAAPAIPSPLRQVRAADTTSDASQVTDADFVPPSAEANRGQDNSAANKSTLAIAKRPRTEEYLSDRDAGKDSGAGSPPTNCSKHVADVLSEERRLYDAKMKLFEDCAAAVDNTLNKAGTDLYPYAKDFGAFFAESLQKWLKRSNPFETKPETATSQGSKTFAKVASSAVTLNPKTSPPVSKASRAPVQGAPAGGDKETDLRIFIRMDNTHLEPYGLKSTIIQKLKLQRDELREVTKCPTGYAMYPKDKATQSKILAFKDDLMGILKPRSIETSVTWHRYQLDGCPRRVFSAEGLAIPITETIVADEAEVQTGARPVRCEISKFSKDTDAEVTWIISFSREINKPFRLFAHSMASRQLRRQPKVLQCENCHKFHGHRYPCNRKTCAKCALPSHDGECEKAIPKCVNCKGPHVATDPKCEARPKVVKGTIHKLDPMQLREVRKAGERARSRAFNEAKKAAAKLSNTNDDTSNVDAQVNMQLDSEVEAACQRQHDNTCDTIVVC